MARKCLIAVFIVGGMSFLAGSVSANPITDYVMYGGPWVNLQGYTIEGDVGSHGEDLFNGVILGGDTTITGDVISAMDIVVDPDSAIQGDAIAGGEIYNGGQIDGTATWPAPAALLDPLLADSFPVPEVITPGAVSHSIYKDTLLLAPGSYADLDLFKSDLFLSSGEYQLSSFSLFEGSLFLDVTGGPITLLSAGTVSLDEFELSLSVDGGSTYTGFADADPLLARNIYVESHDRISVLSGEWFGTLYAPFSSLNVWYTDFHGALYADELNLKGDDNFIDHVSFHDPAPVPEPASLLLLVSGLLGAGLFRRRGDRYSRQ